MSEKIVKGRIVQKHDTAENWSKAVSFIPKQGEVIIYDIDSDYDYERIKIGDGLTLVSDLAFVTDAPTSSINVYHGEKSVSLSNIIETYILTIDYENLLSFDTSEIVFGGSTSVSTSAVLGVAVLGQMVLG